MISTSQKVSCTLAIMSCFSQNCFFLIPTMVSTSSKIVLTKIYCFHYAENPFVLAGWRILINTFPLYGKAASALKKLKKLVSTSRNMVRLKTDFPLISVIVFRLFQVDCCLRKWKKIVFTRPKISFHWLKHGLSLKLAFH